MIKDDIINLLYTKRTFDETIYNNVYQLLDNALNNEINRLILITYDKRAVVYLLTNNDIKKASYINYDSISEFYQTLPTKWLKVSEGLLQVVPIEINHQQHSLRIQLFPKLQKDTQHIFTAFNIDIIR